MANPKVQDLHTMFRGPKLPLVPVLACGAAAGPSLSSVARQPPPCMKAVRTSPAGQEAGTQLQGMVLAPQTKRPGTFAVLPVRFGSAHNLLGRSWPVEERMCHRVAIG